MNARTALAFFVGLWVLWGGLSTVSAVERPERLWERGQTIEGDWTVDAVLLHPEFIRLSLVSSTETTGVEIRYRQDEAPPGSTLAHHLVQPSPSMTPPPHLLRAIETRLVAFEKEHLAGKPSPPPEASPPPLPGGQPASPFSPTNLLFLGLNLLAVLAYLWLMSAFIRAGLFPRAATLAIFLVGLVALLFFVKLPSGFVPVEAISVLHEGLSQHTIGYLFGLSAHMGPNPAVLYTFLTDDLVRLDEVVLFNVILGVVLLVGYFLTARLLVGSIILAFVMTALLYNQSLTLASLSELPSNLTSFYLLLALPAAYILASTRHTRPGLRVPAWLLVVLLGLLTFFTRTEVSGFYVLFIAITLLRAEPLATRLRSVKDRLRRVWEGFLSWPLPAQILAAAALVGVFFLVRALLTSTRHHWYWSALYPLNLSILTLPALMAYFIAPAAIVMTALGFVHSLRKWPYLLALSIGVVVLYRLYVEASHGAFFELFRYYTMLNFPVMVLALFGWHEFSLWVDHSGWDPRWKRVFVLSLALGAFVLLPHGRGIFALPSAEVTDTKPTDSDVQGNLQKEARYLYTALNRYPDCVFIATVQGTRANSGRVEHLVFGKNVAPVSLDTSEGPGSPVRGILDRAACVFYYRSMDCNLVGYTGCDIDLSGYPVIDRQRFPSSQYTDIGEWGLHQPLIELGIYDLSRRPGETEGHGLPFL